MCIINNSCYVSSLFYIGYGQIKNSVIGPQDETHTQVLAQLLLVEFQGFGLSQS